MNRGLGHSVAALAVALAVGAALVACSSSGNSSNGSANTGSAASTGSGATGGGGNSGGDGGGSQAPPPANRAASAPSGTAIAVLTDPAQSNVRLGARGAQVPVDVGRLADRKAPVFAGNVLTTDAPGNVLLDYQSRERCVVRGNTSLVVQNAAGGGDALTLEQGGQDSVVCTDLSAHLTIDTTIGTFQATGTTYSISRGADGSVTVRVLAGSGTLTSKTAAQRSYHMAAGDEGTIQPAGAITQSVVTAVRPTEGEAMTKLKVSARPPMSSAQFSGTALANGKVVPQGSVIEARVGNQVCGTTQVSNRDGSYSLVVHSAEVQPGCGTKDAPVSLVVVPVAPQATPVATQVPFKAGVQPTVRLNLEATTVLVPLTPAPSR